MKKLFIIATALVASIAAMAQVLPANAKAFIEKEFPEQEILLLEGHQSCTVTLDNRIQIEFNKAGQWKEIEAPKGDVLPESVIPVEILNRIHKNWAGQQVVEIQCNNKKVPYLEYEVELTNDTKLKFNSNFVLISIEE